MIHSGSSAAGVGRTPYATGLGLRADPFNPIRTPTPDAENPKQLNLRRSSPIQGSEVRSDATVPEPSGGGLLVLATLRWLGVRRRGWVHHPRLAFIRP
jgi:hypothetical protein